MVSIISVNCYLFRFEKVKKKLCTIYFSHLCIFNAALWFINKQCVYLLPVLSHFVLRLILYLIGILKNFVVMTFR